MYYEVLQKKLVYFKLYTDFWMCSMALKLSHKMNYDISQLNKGS